MVTETPVHVLAPANVRGGGLNVRKGMVVWHDRTLYVASGRPDSPVIRVIADVDEPTVTGKRMQAGEYVATGCGCSNPWRTLSAMTLVTMAEAQGEHAAV